MDRIMLRSLTMLLLTLLFLAPIVVPVAPLVRAEDGGAADSLQTAPASSKLPPVAIGAMRPAGKHLARPREEVVRHWLRKQGLINRDTPPAKVRSLLKDYLADFSKESSVWIAPEVQERALRLQEEAGLVDSPPPGLSAVAAPATTSSRSAVQPVTAKVFALAVDFGGADTFRYSAHAGNSCRYETITVSGPLQGQIPHPGPRDNNTVWYDPADTADATFYEKLIFGYAGMGRVRLDLTDPRDGQPGINLQGYTVQDYYDHVAGKGNVTLQGAVAGWVTVDHSEGYYGAPNCNSRKHDGGGPAPVAQLVVDAAAKFNQAHPDYYNDTGPDAFWPQFDANHDGVLDTFWIIHAGMGQEAGGGPQGDLALWSHSGDLRNYAQWSKGYRIYDGDPQTTADDIVIGPYTMQPENADLGVLVEEFGHNFFGLPDLYTTDIDNSVGFWSIMSPGSWGGWLGGATPVGMPLWFRMIAQCGEQPCNWHQPLFVRAYNGLTRNVTIGSLESTPDGFYKGVRINLPNIVDTGIANWAGPGKGGYTNSGRDHLDITLDRPIKVAADGNGRLTIKSYWDIEEDRDYGYVMINDGAGWVFLDDMDGVLRETNPHGNNLGYGLTGSGNQPLRFDLSSYKGRELLLRLRYRTDASTTGAGWWVDNLGLNGKLLASFEKASLPANFPGWTNSSPGWMVVPTSPSYANYYLVEWRAATKYDKMLRTAYVTSYVDDDEWEVERVPYNIPGALLYYCNTKYDFTYSLRTDLTKAPSIGPKHPLLVVDMNYQPMYLGETGIALTARRGSYDAALTRQASKAFIINEVDGVEFPGPWEFAAKPPVTVFDDAKGYYAGLYADSPDTDSPCAAGSFCYANEGGSAVIPAFGRYSTRITKYDGSPYPELYGQLYRGSVLGTGNPGDEGLALGVRIELLKKSCDNRSATLRFDAPASSEALAP